MQPITIHDIQKLAYDPLSFALIMDNSQLETVIVTFVNVLLSRIPTGGDEN